MAAKELSPGDELYNCGLDTLDRLVEQDERFALFREALDEFNRQGGYFQERPRQEEPAPLSGGISLTSVFERLQQHAPPAELRTVTEQSPYRSVAPRSTLLQLITESRPFRYAIGVVGVASLGVILILQQQVGNLQKTRTLLQQAQHAAQAQPSPSPVGPKTRFAHPLTNSERTHNIPLVQSPLRNWPDEVGLEYGELNDFHEELRSLNYKSVHDKYAPLEDYVISVCRQLKIQDTDLALALLGSGGMMDWVEYEAKGVIEQSIREKLREFKTLGLRDFLRRDILGGRGGSLDEYVEEAQERYRKLFREYEALQGYHQELHNRKEQNRNIPLDTRRLVKPSLQQPQPGASRLEWPEEIPCPDPFYQQQHLQALTVGNGHNVVNPGGIYIVTPRLSNAARGRIFNLEVGISEGSHAADNFHHLGYYALPDGKSAAIEIPFYFKPGVYDLGIVVRFKDECEQFYRSTMRVTNDTFDRAEDQHPKEGIKLKMPHIYD